VSEQELPRWWKLAGFALTCARDEDYQPASRAVERICQVYGPEVLSSVMLAWIDTMISQCGMDAHGWPVGIAWQHQDGGAITDADSTPPAVVWGGRLIGARLADDEGMFRAIYESLETDGQFSSGVSALLTTCGAMLRRAA
jgi:hypothetical protein